MTCESSMSPTPEKPNTAAAERAERLAAQLRANLRRRKDQARGREAAPDEPDRATADEPGGATVSDGAESRTTSDDGTGNRGA